MLVNGLAPSLSTVSQLVVKAVTFSIIWIKHTAIAVWLFLLYAAALWLVLGTMSAFNYQRQVDSLGLGEDVLNQVSELVPLKEDVDYFSAQISSLDNETARLEQTKSEREDTLIELRKSKSAMDDTTEDKIDQIDKNITEIGYEISQYSSYIIRTEDKKNDLISRIEQTNDKISSINTSLGDETKIKQARQLVQDRRYHQRLGFGFLVSMPNHMLTLILTMSMGALGSVIHLTWDLFDYSSKQKLIWYIFRPFLGAILALSIFILLKSGQMFLTNVSITDTSEDLNPFFVSFLAIVSGILSEQAYHRIREAGTKLIASPVVDTPRWIRREVLEGALRAQGKDASQVVPYVHVPLAKVQSWFEEKDAMSGRQQGIVAAWLGLSMRDLFSDQRPEHEAGEGSEGDERQEAEDRPSP